MTTDTLPAFFKTLSIDSNSDNAKFVYYHKATGEIQKISNISFLEEGCECLEVTSDKVVDILLGKKDLSNYKIMFNLKTRALELQENSPLKIVNITDKLHNVPMNSRDPDLIIKCGTEKWTVCLSPQHQDYFRSMTSVVDNLRFSFSITKKNDPNILIDMFNIELYNLLSNPEVDISEQINIPKNMDNISIYTFKYFNNYSYEIINE
jgi:hypothetical protein